MKLAANLTMLFGDAPMWERIDAAADAGFTGIEILQPYGEDPIDLRHTLEAAGPGLVLINTAEPDWEAGGRGHAAVPGQTDAFRKHLDRALAFASDAGAEIIHILAGRAEGAEARETYLANLAFACDSAPDMAFTIEPLNPADQPGYFLNDFEQAADILDTLGRANLSLQFDTYHAHRITGDARAAWTRHCGRVGHVQVAGPDRHEPGADEIALLQAIATSVYTGWISAEYQPKADTEEGLGWMTDLI
ncbi:TIM barrel protein [Alphaproteobacteria bacterium GH1-50]|uniref:TIM barrel protein n=1 Tax=Kangsaoukella pontilimi TaxID=2691042 RepID=A0A7C9MEE0_9RHOB|nr:TIM barrel protein [Kangsaoukella pontilimi]MXQ08771.1 TIM barrel protein [Kangsaoukella pontilimi]